MFIFRKARSPRQTLNDLDAYISGADTKLIEWLAREVKSWGEFSYSELEDVILNGQLNDLIDWQGRYAGVINQVLAPQWTAAMTAASKKATKGKVVLDDSDEYVKAWLNTHGAELVTRLSEESKAALAMIILHGQAQRLNPFEIAKQIRPVIGLNQRQAEANINYRAKIYQQLVENGMSASKAADRADKAAVKYASKQHRYRAETIVNTELAFAYNRGAHMGVSQAIANGYMGRCEMVWSTAGTNRVCSRCMALKDTIVGHTDESGVTIPPLHPRCRCAIIYREIAAPKVISVKPVDFKDEVTKLKQTLTTQRAQGATPAEIEKTIKAAGKLIAGRVKATKIYDLPPEQKIDLPLLQKTFYDFEKRLWAMPSSDTRQELISIYFKVRDEIDDFIEKAQEEFSMIQRGRAEQLKTLLSEVRTMGATKEQLKAQFGNSRSTARKIFETAFDYYPSEWVEKSVKRGTLKPQASKSGRAYYSSGQSVITVVPNSDRKIATAIHEFGHRMEDVIKEILEAETEFYSRRTAGEKLERLRDITGLNYDYYEVTRKDKFLDFYMGKDYGGVAYELVSMGFEHAYTNPALLLQDEEMAEWIFGLLALI